MIQGLFDETSPEERPAPIREALAELARADGEDRGAVFTKKVVVEFILDLVGYEPERRLHESRLLEPAAGVGDFVLPAVDRLLRSYERHGGRASRIWPDLQGALLAFDVHTPSVQELRERLRERLCAWGASRRAASRLVEGWVRQDDFLLAPIPPGFSFVVGNPPYVRQERIPEVLLDLYRRRYETIYDRADLYVPFIQRGLELLEEEGRLSFICTNRWLKNKYGKPLRRMIARGFQLRAFVDMEGTPAFHSEVLAYPGILLVSRSPQAPERGATRVAIRPPLVQASLTKLARRLRGEGRTSNRVHAVPMPSRPGDPWLLDDPDQLCLLRRLEGRFPALEQASCRVGIGVATGADSVFIQAYEDLDVEEERKLPLVLAGDVRNEGVSWSGKGLLNPFDESGELVSLEDWPRFRAVLQEHEARLRKRHVARRNPEGWYKTIDKVYPDLLGRPKLLIPDIKGQAVVAYDPGKYYPHHNLYYVVSEDWDLQALGAVLRSPIAVFFVSCYCTHMAGGFLRFQAQYLRRIRIPEWRDVPREIQRELTESGRRGEPAGWNALARLYGLSEAELEILRPHGAPGVSAWDAQAASGCFFRPPP